MTVPRMVLLLKNKQKIIEPRFRVRKAALNATITLLHWFGARILRSKRGLGSACRRMPKMDRNGDVHVFRGASEHFLRNVERCEHCARTF